MQFRAARVAVQVTAVQNTVQDWGCFLRAGRDLVGGMGGLARGGWAAAVRGVNFAVQ